MIPDREIIACPTCGYLGMHTSSAKNSEFSDCVNKYCGHVYADSMPNSEELDVSLKEVTHCRVITEIPAYRSPYCVLSGKKWLWFIPPVHLQYFTPRSLVKLTSNLGMENSPSSTKSTSPYTCILAYQIFDFLKKVMPTTNLSCSKIRKFVVATAEVSQRIMFSPLSALMRVSGTHNQFIYVFRRIG
jgi:hypothetical protein